MTAKASHSWFFFFFINQISIDSRPGWHQPTHKIEIKNRIWNKCEKWVGEGGQSLGWLRAAVCTLRHSNRAHRPVCHFFSNGIPPFGTEKNTLGLCHWWPPVLCHDKHGTPAYPLTYTETKAREPNMPRASFRSGGKVFNKITIDHDGSRAVRATGQDRNTTQAAVRTKYGQPSTAINTRWGSPLVDRPTGPISFVSSVMLIWARRAAGKCDGLQLFIGMVAIW